MNIIEQIWDALQRAVQKRSPPPLIPTDFWKAIAGFMVSIASSTTSDINRIHAMSCCGTFACSWIPYTILGRFIYTAGQLLRTDVAAVAEWYRYRTVACFVTAKRNRRTTAQQVANQFLAASGKQISRKTVARRLRGGGLYARRPVVCVPLTRQHRTAVCNGVVSITIGLNRTGHAYYSQMSRFSLSSDCRRQLIWRESGTAYRPENIQERTDIRHAVSWCGPAS
ncbi:transposable element Tcb2 transposase [Trichonephila clavipes]|nr:transposable element Tcb2 transposase [Trichonephila clavipes]